MARNAGAWIRAGGLVGMTAIARSRQDCSEFLLQQGLDEASNPGAQAGFDRIEPAVEKECALSGRRCGRSGQGVVSSLTPACQRRRCQGSAPRRLRHLQFQPTSRRHPPPLHSRLSLDGSRTTTTSDPTANSAISHLENTSKPIANPPRVRSDGEHSSGAFGVNSCAPCLLGGKASLSRTSRRGEAFLHAP